jgi:YggT family protein
MPLVPIIQMLFSAYSFIIIARAFLSMAGMDYYNPVMRFIYEITEPLLAPIRRYTVVGMWDLSPIVALILLTIVEQILIALVLGAR